MSELAHQEIDVITRQFLSVGGVSIFVGCFISRSVVCISGVQMMS